jgi:hypothetical protein
MDFNGDGFDDLLWRNDNGMVGYWYGRADGGFSINSKLFAAPLDWQIARTGDFNGDGRDDILWRHSGGAVGYWFGQADGSFTVNNKITGVLNAWHIEGTGDFNGDGRADILWRHDNGTVGTWLGQQDGSFAIGLEVAVPLSWRIGGTGDFDGDGRADILWLGGGANWMGTWSGAQDGTFVINSQLNYNRMGVSGIGDFNADGRDDLVIVDDWSFYSVDYALPGGGFGADDYDPFGDAASSTTLRKIGDFNGDGDADLIFRHTNGTLSVGTFSTPVPNDWHLVGDLTQVGGW